MFPKNYDTKAENENGWNIQDILTNFQVDTDELPGKKVKLLIESIMHQNSDNCRK